MVQLVFKLDTVSVFSCAVFRAKVNDIPLSILLDTGADMPMFCNQTLFRTYFNGNYKRLGSISISGFGGSDLVPLYEIGKLSLSDFYGGRYTFYNLPIAVTPRRLKGANMLISSTMLSFLKVLLSYPTGEIVMRADNDWCSARYDSSVEAMSVYTDRMG